MKKKLAIIGASYLQLPLIQKAREKGLETHVFAWKANDPGEEEADFFYPVSIVEKEEIEQKCREIGIDGICSIASDLAMDTVNYVADRLHLPANSLECTRLSTNKHEMRKAFEKAGCASCKSVEITADTLDLLDDFNWPLIIKPADRSGSRGIALVHTREEAAKAIEQAAKESFHGQVLAENFIAGEEFSIECISQNGKHTFLQATRKQTTGAPHFIETGHTEPAGLSDEILEKVRQEVFKGLDALKITTGASHSEIKVDEKGNLGLIEIGGRMGGDCIGSHLVYYSTGMDFTGMVIDCALGNPLDFEVKRKPARAESHFILTDRDNEKYLKLLKEHPERIAETVDWHPEKIGQTTDSSNRAGCYITVD
ncbi:MAG: ATP-grasp domain-containing protein [Erysipelotrichaceae bacterium]|nr:ATP-grasp domain-containing protein [Erysipelotrichaceae bacterium]